MLMICFFRVVEAAIDEVISQLRAKYTDVTVCEDSKALPYLGMVFDMSDSSRVRISMDKYVRNVLSLYEGKSYACRCRLVLCG